MTISIAQATLIKNTFNVTCGMMRDERRNSKGGNVKVDALIVGKNASGDIKCIGGVFLNKDHCVNFVGFNDNNSLTLLPATVSFAVMSENAASAETIADGLNRTYKQAGVMLFKPQDLFWSAL